MENIPPDPVGDGPLSPLAKHHATNDFERALVEELCNSARSIRCDWADEIDTAILRFASETKPLHKTAYELLRAYYAQPLNMRIIDRLSEVDFELLGHYRPGTTVPLVYHDLPPQLKFLFIQLRRNVVESSYVKWSLEGMYAQQQVHASEKARQLMKEKNTLYEEHLALLEKRIGVDGTVNEENDARIKECHEHIFSTPEFTKSDREYHWLQMDFIERRQALDQEIREFVAALRYDHGAEATKWVAKFFTQIEEERVELEVEAAENKRVKESTLQRLEDDLNQCVWELFEMRKQQRMSEAGSGEATPTNVDVTPKASNSRPVQDAAIAGHALPGRIPSPPTEKDYGAAPASPELLAAVLSAMSPQANPSPYVFNPTTHRIVLPPGYMPPAGYHLSATNNHETFNRHLFDIETAAHLKSYGGRMTKEQADGAYKWFLREGKLVSHVLYLIDERRKHEARLADEHHRLQQVAADAAQRQTPQGAVQQLAQQAQRSAQGVASHQHAAQQASPQHKTAFQDALRVQQQNAEIFKRDVRGNVTNPTIMYFHGHFTRDDHVKLNASRGRHPVLSRSHYARRFRDELNKLAEDIVEQAGKKWSEEQRLQFYAESLSIPSRQSMWEKAGARLLAIEKQKYEDNAKQRVEVPKIRVTISEDNRERMVSQTSTVATGNSSAGVDNSMDAPDYSTTTLPRNFRRRVPLDVMRRLASMPTNMPDKRDESDQPGQKLALLQGLKGKANIRRTGSPEPDAIENQRNVAQHPEPEPVEMVYFGKIFGMRPMNAGPPPGMTKLEYAHRLKRHEEEKKNKQRLSAFNESIDSTIGLTATRGPMHQHRGPAMGSHLAHAGFGQPSTTEKSIDGSVSESHTRNAVKARKKRMAEKRDSELLAPSFMKGQLDREAEELRLKQELETIRLQDEEQARLKQLEDDRLAKEIEDRKLAEAQKLRVIENLRIAAELEKTRLEEERIRRQKLEDDKRLEQERLRKVEEDRVAEEKRVAAAKAEEAKIESERLQKDEDDRLAAEAEAKRIAEEKAEKYRLATIQLKMKLNEKEWEIVRLRREAQAAKRAENLRLKKQSRARAAADLKKKRQAREAALEAQRIEEERLKQADDARIESERLQRIERDRITEAKRLAEEAAGAKGLQDIEDARIADGAARAQAAKDAEAASELKLKMESEAKAKAEREERERLASELAALKQKEYDLERTLAIVREVAAHKVVAYKVKTMDTAGKATAEMEKRKRIAREVQALKQQQESDRHVAIAKTEEDGRLAAMKANGKPAGLAASRFASPPRQSMPVTSSSKLEKPFNDEPAKPDVTGKGKGKEGLAASRWASASPPKVLARSPPFKRSALVSKRLYNFNLSGDDPPAVPSLETLAITHPKTLEHFNRAINAYVNDPRPDKEIPLPGDEFVQGIEAAWKADIEAKKARAAPRPTMSMDQTNHPPSVAPGPFSKQRAAKAAAMLAAEERMNSQQRASMAAAMLMEEKKTNTGPSMQPTSAVPEYRRPTYQTFLGVPRSPSPPMLSDEELREYYLNQQRLAEAVAKAAEKKNAAAMAIVGPSMQPSSALAGLSAIEAREQARQDMNTIMGEPGAAYRRASDVAFPELESPQETYEEFVKRNGAEVRADLAASIARHPPRPTTKELLELRVSRAAAKAAAKSGTPAMSIVRDETNTVPSMQPSSAPSGLTPLEILQQGRGNLVRTGRGRGYRRPSGLDWPSPASLLPSFEECLAEYEAEVRPDIEASKARLPPRPTPMSADPGNPPPRAAAKSTNQQKAPPEPAAKSNEQSKADATHQSLLQHIARLEAVEKASAQPTPMKLPKGAPALPGRIMGKDGKPLFTTKEECERVAREERHARERDLLAEQRAKEQRKRDEEDDADNIM